MIAFNRTAFLQGKETPLQAGDIILCDQNGVVSVYRENQQFELHDPLDWECMDSYIAMTLAEFWEIAEAIARFFGLSLQPVATRFARLAAA